VFDIATSILLDLGYTRIRTQHADGTRQWVYRREPVITSDATPDFPW
jgi:hypothetical protein